MSNAIQSYIINNIGLIIAFILAVIGFIGSAIGKKKQSIYANLYSLISDAEQLTDKTETEQFQKVFDKAYTALPGWFKLFISEDDIERGIEFSFNKLKAFSQQQSQTPNTPAPVAPVPTPAPAPASAQTPAQ